MSRRDHPRSGIALETPTEHPPEALSRRDFLALVGGAAALAATSGCVVSPPEEIVPYADRPPEVTPGLPRPYATALVLDGAATGLVVQTREGRPVKVEGNPEHPASRGASGVFEQAAVLGLYDPSRLQGLRHGDRPVTWGALEVHFAPPAAGRRPAAEASGPGAGGGDGRGAGLDAGGEAPDDYYDGLALLLEPTSSPLRAELLERLRRRRPGVRIYFHAPLAPRASLEGTRRVFGRPLATLPELDRAEVVVALGSDLLASGPYHLRNARDWAERRRIREPSGTQSRVYAAEPVPTPTGTSSDHRLRAKPSELPRLAGALLEALPGGGGAARAAATGSSLSAEHQAWVEAAAADLARHRGRAVVVAGAAADATTHALVALCNRAIAGAVRYREAPVVECEAWLDGRADLAALAGAIAAGRVRTLAILGGNPAYTAPAEIPFAKLLERVPETLYLGLHETETARLCRWLVPELHPFESWGDARAWDRTPTFQQPLIRPLFGGSTVDEILALFAGAVPGGEEAEGGLATDWGAGAWREAALAAAGVGDESADGESADGRGGGAVPAARGGAGRTAAGSRRPRPAAHGAALPVPGGIAAEGDRGEGEGEREGEDGAAVAERPRDGDGTLARRLLRASWRRRYEAGEVGGSHGSFADFWRASLRRGFVADADAPPAEGTTAEGFTAERPTREGPTAGDPAEGSAAEGATTADPATVDPAASPPDGGGGPGPVLELHFPPSPATWDGRFASIPWLLELPQPISKLTWGNAVLTSPRTARELGIAAEARVEVSVGGHSVRGRLLPLPGHADGVLTLPLGWGRTAGAGPGEQIGFNAYRVRFTDGGTRRVAVRVVSGAEEGPEEDRLASSQPHWDLRSRPVFLAATLDHFRRHPEFVKPHTGPQPTLYEGPPRTAGEQWAMTVDLTLCTGCSACVVACQAENNVPVVGPRGVRRGREMHWLRVDRYVTGPEDDPRYVHQPMACQHCEKAPCEYVCPVNATVHSEDGLNEMVYNRCVGTRFCSNNCPYKVRRFNWLDYNDPRGPLESLVLNPDVTVRERGVMEKCTYCVQRIRRAGIQAELAERPLRDGDVVTACQQACPTEAIVFGSLTDAGSLVSTTRRSPHAYEVLHELGTRPRTRYLARIHNPSRRLHRGGPDPHEGEPWNPPGGADPAGDPVSAPAGEGSLGAEDG